MDGTERETSRPLQLPPAVPSKSLREEIRIDIDGMPAGVDDEKSWWICRVHPSVREKGGQAYEPKLVSVGPLHHGKPSLQPMEATKKRYLRKLLARSPETNTLDRCIEAIREIEGYAKEEYYPEQEVQKLGSDAFVTMLLVDGCFIVEYMLREFFGEKQEEGGDGMWWGSLERDLMLLENQIPFFVLQQLFDRTRAPSPQGTPPPPTSLTQIALHLLDVEADQSKLRIIDAAGGVSHLLHLSHMCWQLYDATPAASKYSRAGHAVVALLSYPIRAAVSLIKHAVFCLLFLLLINEWPWSRHEPDLLKKIPCATDLDNSGVKFRRKDVRKSAERVDYCCSNISIIRQWRRWIPRLTVCGVPWRRWIPRPPVCGVPWRGWIPCGSPRSNPAPAPLAPPFTGSTVRIVKSSECLYSRSNNISFRGREGVLEIPFVAVGQTLDARLRNFIALEQCQRNRLGYHYTTYVSFMNNIIYTPADVALLRKNGIIEILFGSDDDVAKMFKSIYEDTNLYKVEIDEIYLLSKQVNVYCDVAYHRWRGRLRRSYLRRPWSAIALVVGGVGLSLTVAQTIFTIRQSYK